MKDITKKKIQESITNLSNLGIIPKDEVQLNLDVMYNSILDDICTIVPMNSPRQVISCFDFVYDSPKKSSVSKYNDKDKVTNDAYKHVYMNNLGATPLNETGYPTDIVTCECTLLKDGYFVANYSDILPQTIKIYDGTSSAINITDDGEGNLVDYNSSNIVGTINYNTGVFKLNEDVTKDNKIKYLKYKYNNYDIENYRNSIQLIKRSREIFADLYKLDIDYAVSLESYKSLNIKDRLKTLLPQLLTQQIDKYAINKLIITAEKYENNLKYVYNANNKLTDNVIYDLELKLRLIMSNYAYVNGVMPNIIICDPTTYGYISCIRHFVSNIDEKYTGILPRIGGYLGDVKVIVTNFNSIEYPEFSEGYTGLNTKGKLVMLYKGVSEAQSVATYTPYVPVSTRFVSGMEGQGMIKTSNVYSISGFTVTNPQLVCSVDLTFE